VAFPKTAARICLTKTQRETERLLYLSLTVEIASNSRATFNLVINWGHSSLHGYTCNVDEHHYDPKERGVNAWAMGRSGAGAAVGRGDLRIPSKTMTPA